MSPQAETIQYGGRWDAHPARAMADQETPGMTAHIAFRQADGPQLLSYDIHKAPQDLEVKSP